MSHVPTTDDARALGRLIAIEVLESNPHLDRDVVFNLVASHAYRRGYDAGLVAQAVAAARATIWAHIHQT